MTAQALVTIIAPLAGDRLADAQAEIAGLGNPAAPELAKALDRLDSDGSGTHFASLHAFGSSDGRRAWLLLEFSADGSPDEAIARIAAAIGERMYRVFILASDWREGAEIAAYLARHRIKVGQGWRGHPGLGFSGMPGFSVGRIRAEARLTAVVASVLAAQPGELAALDRLESVRAAVAADPSLAPATAGTTFARPPIGAVVARLVPAFVTIYLWPFILLVLAWAIFSGARSAWHAPDIATGLRLFLTNGLYGLWWSGWMTLLAVLLGAGILYILLRRAEARDAVDDRAPDRITNAAMFERENRVAQNHMISITERKPGFVRAVTLRLIFWAIGQLGGFLYRAGFLGSIGSIHFARWVTVPGSSELVFLSNYDGSWESYLEDFITRAHAGLTGVWSNARGFPKTESLILKGATDGERFKRYARRSMIPTLFWYSAYPALTMSAIRTNAEVRRGLSGAMTGDEATAFLALFGSAARPPDKLVTSEIQSLVFGGLGFMKHGLCMIFDLPDDVALARAWLRRVKPHIAFNDGRRLKASAVVTLALGAGGLRRLGLPEQALEGFAFPFVEGMTSAARSRILGDLGDNAPGQWRWGRQQPDVALLIYGSSNKAVQDLRSKIELYAEDSAMRSPHLIPLKPVTSNKREPFGFVDGISQPVIRGTYKGFRFADPIHLVEAGEFILGYPDNRGHIPPGPQLSAIADPENLLPLVSAPAGFDRTVVDRPRDLGFNGSYLVIRELEQDVDAFHAYCQAEADRLEASDRLPPPYVCNPEFIAAKLIGRWRNGSSLARHPYEPALSKRFRAASHPTVRPTSLTAGNAPPIERPASESDERDNDFIFGAEDPEALRCPFGAHIRRANPRDSLAPGSADQIDITNRHRIIRVGRFYEQPRGAKPGLFFMCLNGDIERQFEFLQQTWLNSPSFHGLSCEKDPVLGDAEEGACGFTIPSRDGPVSLSPMPRFVTTRGGGYFFLPGKRLIDFLGKER